MFSGIVSSIGEIVEVFRLPDSAKIKISSNSFFANTKLGDSIAVSGVCLTATKFDEDSCVFDISNETLKKTSMNSALIGRKVNLEKSLKFGDSLDGHLVYGHVDDMLRLEAIEQEGETWKFSFEITKKYSNYIIQKGSVTIDGVSLTVGDVSELIFNVYVIPYTFENTIFKFYKVGDHVNFEIDPIARYAVNAAMSLFGPGRF